VKVIGTGLGYHIHHAAREAAVLGGITVGDDAKLVYGVGIRDRVAGVAQTVGVGSSVEIVVHRADAGVGRAVDIGLLLGSPEVVSGLAREIHTGDQSEQTVDIAVYQRQLFDVLAIDRLAQSGNRGFHHGGVSRHFDCFRDGPDLKHSVHLRFAVDLQNDSGLFKFLETGHIDFHAVRADREKEHGIAAVRLGNGATGDVGLDVGCDDSRVDNRRSTDVGYISRDGSRG